MFRRAPPVPPPRVSSTSTSSSSARCKRQGELRERRWMRAGCCLRAQYKAGAPRAATRSFPISHSSSPSLLPPCFAFFLHLPPHPTPPLLFLFFSSTPSVFPPSTAAFSMIKTRNKASRGLQPGLAACARAASSKSLLVHSHREKPRLPALPVYPETNQELN